VDRRQFLRRLGIGTAGVAGVAAPVGAYAIGHRQGESTVEGNYSLSVKAGQRRGAANVWWSVHTDAKVLALTFDDGPTNQFTASVLDVLGSYHVPASFFLIGELVTRHPDHVRRILDEGHEVANHTFDHYGAARQSPDETRRTVERGADAVGAISGARPRWFRPVKGEITGALLNAAAEIGHDVAVWSVSRDPGIGTADDDVAGVRANYIDGLHEGAVVIFHDGIGRSAFEMSGPDEQLLTQRRTELAALPDVIERYLADGYEFLGISDLIDRYGRPQ
jgi:peptidoglycan/xylan/chitin deacetylase (PgdA/CDA1 family)